MHSFTYSQAEDFLFNQLPIYQNLGQAAFNRSLGKTKLLLKHLGNPEKKFKSIHVAGTNGKGSSCHMIASVLQQAGYKTGLHTSPHLKSYTERVRINGLEIEKDYITSFIGDNFNFFNEQVPSFFEITVALAFCYFSDKKVDIAVIEVGMGGRFDSTNVLNPMVSLITNIGLDHQHILGNTIAEIAEEKAGIIKKNTPVVIGTTQKETKEVFIRKAKEVNGNIIFADKLNLDLDYHNLDLKGNYQKYNLPGVQTVIDVISKKGFAISDETIKDGLANVIKNTGLNGRWQELSDNPLTMCDTAHNEDGLKEIVAQIQELKFDKLYIVFGMVNDKSSIEILKLLPQKAYYFFTEPKIPRAKKAEELYKEAVSIGLKGEVVPDVANAIQKAEKKSTKQDMIYIGGSTFVVAEIDNL